MKFICNNLKMTLNMKKKYIAPALSTEFVEEESMMAASIRTIGGDTDLEIGTGDTPTEADVKGNYFGGSIFDE